MMGVLDADKQVLRALAGEYAEIAALPVHKEKAELWRRLNRLEPVRPLVWINEIPWHEMNVDDELTLRCTDPYLQGVEGDLRRTIYLWKHLPGDMVIDPIWYVGYVCGPAGTYGDYGIEANEIAPDCEGLGSREFVPVINSEADVDKLHTPEVFVDWEQTERHYQLVKDTFGDIVTVEKRGIVHQWGSPWDQMIHWYGIEKLFMDMVDRPELVHYLLTKFMAAVHEVLDKQVEMGLLSVSNGNHRVGSGGLGITDELPQPDYVPGTPARLIDQWGTSTGQIFSEVSPDMHEEFSLQYERPYMERFGLSCYGCCEPLHNKMGILRKVKNLRRISMSYWINIDKAVQEVQDDYVFSYKPTPSVFAWDNWDPEPARANLREVLEKTKDCRVELIMKDISTVRNQPQRLWEWARLASEMAEGVTV
ncbi:MAG: uroporphyrinogen decarboxylase family protein [Armatimonadota bacterium]